MRSSVKSLMLKELKLVLHPMCPFMLATSLLVLVPSWPYVLIMLYVVICPFVNALNAREFQDFDFSIVLPVSRRDIVSARIFTTVLIEVACVCLMYTASLLRPVIGVPGILVGMPPNLTFMGMAFAIFAVFNAAFYLRYWRNPLKAGIPFMLGLIPAFVLAVIFEILPYADPSFALLFAQEGMANLGMQLVFFVSCLVAFVLVDFLVVRKAAALFEHVDC